jgi:uncharacterized lipoprotein NlpE involved in copper resistance
MGAKVMRPALLLSVFFLFGCDNNQDEREAEAPELSEVEEAKYKIVDEFLKEYEVAERTGNRSEKCWRAGMVATAYREADDDAAYRKWKAIQKDDCEV